MKKLIEKIKGHSKFITSIENCEREITPILQGFITNFPDYTDHSINHSKTVLGYSELVLSEELDKLNEDEVYILIMAGFLHDIGMCPTSKMKTRILESNEFKESNKSFENYLRDIHHELSYEYITTHWEKLGIINDTYAHAVALVGMGHRVVNLLDFDQYKPEYAVKNGTEFVCLPYLASILRLSDELDITNDRTPELLYSEYLPENKVSKKEWDKHKSNYFVNFSNHTIKVTAKCTDKDIYYALLKHYGKIEEVIKYVQKVVANIPRNERSLKINFIKLEKDIQTSGFIPKSIGFTFDLQNTINTFIGTNIYKNKFVAIRECLQNSIDSCRYKLHLTKSSYQPEIKVILKDQLLIISDNGVGMDEYIVENYFAKLSKSYYSESKVSREFEAISQFGVGVFSYFLLCDYFDVETKQTPKETLKFRVTKNAENYFYFFDSFDRNESGTTITIHLSSEIEYDELVDQIKNYIRFLEFPIKVSFGENMKEINSEKFEIDKFELLEKRVGREYKNVLKNLITVDSEYSDEFCEGVLGLLMGKEDNTFIPIKEYDTLKTYHTSKIEVSQKGVYLGDFSSSIIKNLLGKINLKHKNEIDLGRYQIKNETFLNGIYENFYKLIISKVFKNWKDKEPSIRYKLCRDFIGYYFEYHILYSIEVLELLYSNLYIKLFDGSNIQYVTIGEVCNYKELTICRKETPLDNYTYNDIDFLELYKKVNCPIIIESWSPPASFMLNIFKARKNSIKIACLDNHWFFKISPQNYTEDIDNIQENLRFRGNEVYKFDKPHICAYTSLSIETPFNLDNEIVGFYITEKERIAKNKVLSLLYKEMFEEISRFFGNFHFYPEKNKNITNEINYFNGLLNKINHTQGSNFKLTEKDFPSWMNQKINWSEVK
ncbi:MAG: ATP-binding protein [Bacteroidia bacterium]|nr:ATP-binding protein [Bacteroidia bacterium]